MLYLLLVLTIFTLLAIDHIVAAFIVACGMCLIALSSKLNK